MLRDWVIGLRVKSIRRCLHKQWNYHLGIQLALLASLVSFQIDSLSIKLNGGWNVRLLDESERSTANFIWVISRGSTPCYFTDISWQSANHITRYCCPDVRGWSVSCREIGIGFQSKWMWWFPLWSFIKTLRESTYSVKGHPARHRKLLVHDRCSWVRVCVEVKEHFCKGQRCSSESAANQTWRPFILRMLWLQCFWLYTERHLDKNRNQTVEHVSLTSNVFVLGHEWFAKIANFVQYLRGFHWGLLYCEYSYFYDVLWIVRQTVLPLVTFVNK